MSPAVDEETFYSLLSGHLAAGRPDLDGQIDPAAQLWTTGYLDSFGLIETLTFLEELLGHPIELGLDDLSSFLTMKDMYLAFVAE